MNGRKWIDLQGPGIVSRIGYRARLKVLRDASVLIDLGGELGQRRMKDMNNLIKLRYRLEPSQHR